MIFIGRFVEVKNVYFILNILKELYKINPNFNFIFLGFGPEQTKMQKFAKDNGGIDYTYSVLGKTIEKAKQIVSEMHFESEGLKESFFSVIQYLKERKY